MRNSLSRVILLAGMLVVAFALIVYPAAAGDTVLSNNSGADNAVFHIAGEATVVINGFDLTPLGLSLPVALDAVTISVQSIVPGSSIEVLVYQDANGGSPVDGTLVYREQTAIGLTGVNRIVLAEPAIITEPVVWVGFNLPVGFEFHADTSGASVLTYWAWTPGGAFDLTALSSAAVLGPSDGTQPVNIAMGGIARITAELRTAQLEEVSAAIPLGRQIVPNVAQDTSIMRAHNDCAGLLYDPEDIEISADSSFTLDCYVEGGFHSPVDVAQPQDQILELLRMGPLYKLSAHIPTELQASGAVSTLPVPVTHCLRVPAEDLNSAVIGEVRAQFAPKTGPEKWVILPSVRFNDIVCAEVTVANYVTYFVPEDADTPQNVNLVLGWTRVDPHPLYCGVDASVLVPVVNTGQDWFDTEDSHVTLMVQDIHVSSGITDAERRFDIGASQLGPGNRQFYELGPLSVDTYIGDLHRIQVTVDQDNEVDEISESDNTWFTEYVLTFPPGRDQCGPPSLEWEFKSCRFRFKEDFSKADEAVVIAIEDLEHEIIFPEDLFATIGDLDVARKFVLGTIASESWELVESWFFRSRQKIAAEMAQAIVRYRGAMNACRDEV